MVQRVTKAAVAVEGRPVAEIGNGVVVLLGVGRGDTAGDARYLAEKTAHLRIFEDAHGKMNRSLLDSGGSALVVSQFTLFGDCRKGRRPGFTAAATGPAAVQLYEQYCSLLAAAGVPVRRGMFGADMLVEIYNDGPVTILLDSAKLF